ncbi:MAG TPA: PAS domain S-box protein [Bacteroidales bacterium]|nr:PAS domain S-box protein [Bacteroidales bacterium]HRX97260.1 PAS domain S-box protein [Bacteroidales bacterium]
MKKLKILLLEDNLNDAELVEIELRSSLNQTFELTRVDNRIDYFKQIVLFKPDIILSDYRLPQYNGLSALEDLKSTNENIPFIIVTGSLTEETAADSIKAGAWDYVVKERLFRLPTAVKNALSVKNEQTKKQMAESKLKTLSAAVEHAPVSILITDDKGNIDYANPKFEEITGYALSEVTGKKPRILRSNEHSPTFYAQLWNTIKKGEEWNGQFRNIKKNGESFWVNATISGIKDESTKITKFVGIQEDITEKKKAQDDLHESEKRYQMLSAATFEAIFISENGICINQNQTANKIFGYSLQEIIGKPIIELVEKNSRENTSQKIESKYNKSYEARALCKDGRTFPCEIQSKIMEGKSLKVMYTAIRDISQRKLAEKALIKSEKKYRELIINQGEGILVANTEEIISFANPAAENLFGVRKNGLINKSLVDFVIHNDLEKLESEGIKRLQSKRSTYELSIKRPDGEIRHLLVTASPRLDENVNVIGSFGIFRDITDRKQIMVELQAAKERAEESDKLKTVFLQNMSHEIRTPMNGIIGFAEMLTDESLSKDKTKEFAEIVINSSKQLLSIIQDIITMSSLETNQEKVVYQALKMNELLDEFYLLNQTTAKGSGIDFKIEKNLSDEDALIMTDITKFRQVLSNLINNAFKFTHTGSINVSYKLNNSDLEFCIKDTGIGIKPELQQKVFSRFWQVEQGTTRKYGGTGLGLAITKGYIELLGGKIWLKSIPGKGSAFHFTIPYKSVVNGMRKEATRVKSKTVNLTGKTILIAEDEMVNFRVLSELLRHTNAKIVHARNGKEAVEICKKQMPDLILMDIKMPVMDGYEATKEIRKMDTGVPIIAQTAYINTEDEEKTKKIGCNAFISKPFQMQELIDVIEKQIRELVY